HVALGILAQEGIFAQLEGPHLKVHLRPYRPGEAADYRLVVTATGDPEVDGAVHRDAEEAGVWVNSADDPGRSSFFLPALARDGPVTVAVSTGGASPALASWLRTRAAEALGPGLGHLAALLDEGRRRLKERGAHTESVDWAALLEGPLPDLVRRGELDGARGIVDAAVEGASPASAAPS
ncbi:MAG TPA: bifunctional precorrin-2 dehydrogenase/sirohydrochlorin ferrochelatase, partial [Acidimicrobiales bacterium]|nr:bifunctional precorrin-2 dehydrogenase/sirohydrochlorin ferrochelatase [Acidimicrobiales bacterium]